MTTTCTVNGCDRPIQARQLCPSHYTRWRRHRNTGGPIGPKPLTTEELADELCWQLDAGESAWQAIRRLNMNPATALKRIERAKTLDPKVRTKLITAYNPIVKELRAAA